MHLEVRELTKRYGRLRALDRVSLQIEPGQIIALIGLNGAGKSTLLNCLAARTAPDSGEVLYDGVPLRRDHLELRRRFFFLPDFPLFLPGKSLVRNLSVILRLYEADGPGAEDRVLELLEAFDLLPLGNALPEMMSRGQAYKAALTGVMSVDPELWLLDEPFASGMDPLGLAVFRREAKAAAGRGRTILYSTQMLETAERFADRVIILNDGRLCAFDSLERLGVSKDGDGIAELFARLRDEGSKK